MGVTVCNCIFSVLGVGLFLFCSLPKDMADYPHHRQEHCIGGCHSTNISDHDSAENEFFTRSLEKSRPGDSAVYYF